MRLTLRTILAYLDDVLEPTQARELGEKIGQSREASELIAKIQEVIRRRRIGAPEIAGPGSGPDPNLVSEYLENTLPPDQVVELEKLCRQSDVHLAEVVACHKILTMVIGQPVEVSEELRDRMHALGSRKVDLTTFSGRAEIQPMTTGLGSGHQLDHTEGLPKYLRPNSTGKKIWTALMVMLVLGAWVALVVSDKSIWESQGQPEVVNNEQSDDEVEAAHGDLAAEQTGGDVAVTEQASVKANNIAESELKSAETTVVSANPPPPPENVTTTNEIPTPKVDLPVAANQVIEVVPPPEPDPQLLMPEETADVKPPVPNAVIAISNKDGFSISNLPGEEQWQVKKQGTITVGETFAVPEPFQNEIVIDDDLVIEVRSHSKLRRGPTDAGALALLEIERGRFVITRPDVSIEEATLGLQLDSDRWNITFLQPDTRIALTVIPPQPSRFPPDANRPLLQGGLALISGKVQLTVNGQVAIELDENSGWLNFEQLKNATEPVNGGSIPLEYLTETPTTVAMRQIALAFEREFGPDVFLTVSPVVNDRRARISELAAMTVALLGEQRELVGALQSEHEETRRVSIIELRHWLAGDPNRSVEFREEARRHFQDEVVERLERLLWGYDENDGRSPEISAELVDLMGDSELAIRELAFFYVSRLSGRDYDYHAQLQPVERRAAVNRWKEFLSNEGSLVPAEQ